MELSKDDIAFIKELSHKMKTQDTRGTAQPYALIIGEKTTRVTDPQYSDKIAVHWNETDHYSLDALTASIAEYYDDEHHPAIQCITENIDDMSDLFRYEYKISQLLGDSFNVYAYEEVEDFSGSYGGNFFITEESAKNYIEQNRHNLSEPFTYGIHLRRNPEMAKLYEIIHKLAELVNWQILKQNPL